MTQPFTRISGIAASLPEENVDTDVIYPARFLLITTREGLGAYAFHDRRFDSEGQEISDFVLNRDPWRGAPILITGANFGCGSSREHAVWTLLDVGIGCVIGPSFGEIFNSNCYRNGLLPIVLPLETVAKLAALANEGKSLTVDLPSQTISAEGMEPISFSIAPDRKEALLNGWDETAILLNLHGDGITTFEARQQVQQPWLYEEEASR